MTEGEEIAPLPKFAYRVLMPTEYTFVGGGDVLHPECNPAG